MVEGTKWVESRKRRELYSKLQEVHHEGELHQQGSCDNINDVIILRECSDPPRGGEERMVGSCL
jgi:hypothetical protein